MARIDVPEGEGLKREIAGITDRERLAGRFMTVLDIEADDDGFYALPEGNG